MHWKKCLLNALLQNAEIIELRNTQLGQLTDAQPVSHTLSRSFVDDSPPLDRTRCSGAHETRLNGSTRPLLPVHWRSKRRFLPSTTRYLAFRPLRSVGWLWNQVFGKRLRGNPQAVWKGWKTSGKCFKCFENVKMYWLIFRKFSARTGLRHSDECPSPKKLAEWALLARRRNLLKCTPNGARIRCFFRIIFKKLTLLF